LRMLIPHHGLRNVIDLRQVCYPSLPPPDGETSVQTVGSRNVSAGLTMPRPPARFNTCV